MSLGTAHALALQRSGHVSRLWWQLARQHRVYHETLSELVDTVSSGLLQMTADRCAHSGLQRMHAQGAAAPLPVKSLPILTIHRCDLLTSTWQVRQTRGKDWLSVWVIDTGDMISSLAQGLSIGAARQAAALNWTSTYE